MIFLSTSIAPNINYDIDATIAPSGEVTDVEGGMDGFPSTSVDVNGGTVFDNQEGKPKELWGSSDVKIEDDDLDLSNQGSTCSSN